MLSLGLLSSRLPSSNPSASTSAPSCWGHVSGIQQLRAVSGHRRHLDDLYIARKESPGSLLRNTGHGDFKDVTDLAAPSLAQQSNFSVWHDYNEDGYPDLYLVRNGKNLLYENICSATITPPH